MKTVRIALTALMLVAGLAVLGGPAAYADTLIVDNTDACDDGTGSPAYCTMQAAIDAASPGDTINVAAGTYSLSSTVNVNKANLTLAGDDLLTTLIQADNSIGYAFSVTASGVTLRQLDIEKTDKAGPQNLIYIGASDVTIEDNEIHGQYVLGDPDVSRAMEVTYGLSGLRFAGNEIYSLRQPAYINGSIASPTTGTIEANHVYGTKGWVIDGANMTFTGNSWGTGAQANYLDIAILAGTDPSYYPDIAALSAANNGAVVEDQRTSPRVLSIVYVDASAPSGGDGTVTVPYQTIGEGIIRVAAGGMVNVAAGTYNETVNIAKPVTLRGANAGVHPTVGTHSTELVGTRGPETILSHNYPAMHPTADNIVVDGFKFTGAGGRIIDTYDAANAFHLTNCIFDNPTSGTTQGVIQFGGGSHTDMLLDFNLFQDQGDHTLYVGGGPYDRLRIAYNRFNGLGDGVFWAASKLSDGVIEGNEFDGTIGGTPGQGGTGLNIGQGGNIVIRNNWFHDMYYTAFQVGIENGSIVNKTFEDMYPIEWSGTWYPSHAFELWGGEWGTAASTNVAISGNIINFNNQSNANAAENGIRLRPGVDAPNIHINDNAFIDKGSGSTSLAVRNQGTGTVDAPGNWWGDASGPTHSTNIGGIGGALPDDVAYSPWLGIGTDADPAAMGFQPASPMTWYVNTSYNQQPGNLRPGNLQLAVNMASPGDTVNVLPGTYGSQVWPNQAPFGSAASDRYAPALIVWRDNLTIQAVDSDPSTTIIKSTHNAWSNPIAIRAATGGTWTPGAWGSMVGGGVIPTAGSAPNAISLIASGVTIDGFTLQKPDDGTAAGGFWNTAGVMIGGLCAGDTAHLGSNGNTVQNNVFSDLWHAIYIWHSDHNTIVNNTVEALGDTGHWAAIESYDGYNDEQIGYGNPSTCNTISHNSLADKGIFVGAWAPPTWTDNTDTMINYNVATAIGRGYSSGPAMACWNTLPGGDDIVPWAESADPWDPCKPTAITLASFTTQAGLGSVTLAWETGTEVDNAGFNLYRASAADGPYVKVTSKLIAAEGDPVAGASYSFLDKGLESGTYYYKLEDVDLNGVTTLHGPVSATVLPRLRRPSYRPKLP